MKAEHLHLGHLADASFQSNIGHKYFCHKYICQNKEKQQYIGRYSKYIHRTKYQALTMTRLTHSPYT